MKGNDNQFKITKVNLKKASELIGSSPSFFKQLIAEGKLTKYRINSAVFISLEEFENLMIKDEKFNHRVETHIQNQ